MPHLVGEKLRHIRRERGLTQTELAQQLGAGSQSHIAKVESGEDAPSLGFVIRVAELLNVSTDYFLRDTITVEASQQALIAIPSQNLPFGERLRRLRLDHGLSQGDLARRLGLTSRAYIGGLETKPRKMPSLDLIVRIADVFGVSTDSLLVNMQPQERTPK